MKQYYIRKISPESANEVINDIGFDKVYIPHALSKYDFLLLKIDNVQTPGANIIKQLALSIGADAAVHREVITCKVESTDLLLGCTIAQLKELAEKLKHQPFGLKELADQLLEQVNHKYPMSLNMRGNVFDWAKKTYIMGILNVTPDSFSDGGKYFDTDAAVNQALKMIQSGADIIDIGGESTRPFSQEVVAEEELNRVLPVIAKIRELNKSIPLSIDTRHAVVAKEAVKVGADIVNDVSGFDHDPDMLSVVAELQVPVVIMHSLSCPETMQVNPVYTENVIDAVYKSLYDKTRTALAAGIKRENIIIDPGIGFGKTVEHNFEIIRRIKEFTSMNHPLLVGVSRKSVIAKVIDTAPEEREEANIALSAYLAQNGTNIIRVHDVEKHCKAFKVLDRVIRGL